MKHISVLIKPASSLCNIRCKYCFYANVSSLREVRSLGRMKQDISRKMIENIYVDLEDGDELTLAFQGGEPTLAGLPYFRYIISLINEQKKRVRVHYAIQTNGIVINQKWSEFLKEHNFLVGLSIDGHPIYHDMNRVDPKGRGTFHKVLRTKELFDEYQIEYNVLCVLTNPLAKEAQKVFRFIKEQNIQYVQFIPCLDELNAEKRNAYASTTKRFGSFYHKLFQLWMKELRNKHYISIKLFDDLVNLTAFHTVSACGMLGNCQVQYVIEADGSVYPCDFYVLDEYRMGYIQENTLKELFEQDRAYNFLCNKDSLNEECYSCPFWQVCQGGCKRMKDAMYIDKDKNCGYRQLLEEFLPRVEEILRLLERVS